MHLRQTSAIIFNTKRVPWTKVNELLSGVYLILREHDNKRRKGLDEKTRFQHLHDAIPFYYLQELWIQLLHLSFVQIKRFAFLSKRFAFWFFFFPLLPTPSYYYYYFIKIYKRLYNFTTIHVFGVMIQRYCI